MRPLRLPPGVPRTKPRAMGIGLRYARGSLITVYDAEDQPDPEQLKKAAWGFARVDGSVACLQAKLGYYNPRQNLLTRWFTLEYDAWFNIFLPGLHRIGAPIPLGGDVEPLPPRARSRPASAGTRTTSPRTPTSACASPASG